MCVFVRTKLLLATRKGCMAGANGMSMLGDPANCSIKFNKPAYTCVAGSGEDRPQGTVLKQDVLGANISSWF
jgi:hypothetical protein